MKTTRLGKTELEVSRIAFGTWQVSGEWGSYDTDDAQKAIRHALELGVNFFDTAQAYGFGESEQVLAGALRHELDHDRDSVVIATKGGINPGTDRPRDSSREYLRSGVEASLQAMKIDHIDLYQIHWPDTDTPFAETAGYLQELVDEGQDPPRRASPTSTRPRSPRSTSAAPSRPCSRRITCSAAASRPTCSPTSARTTSARSCTRRWARGC